MKTANFFAELKRRNVIRMAGLYLVGAWLLTQVASTVLPTFDVPSWILRGFIITLVIGFIPALIFSWVFELTPQGLKRDEDVSPEQSIAPQTARRMDRMIIVVLLLALAYFCFDKFVLTPRREVALVAAASSPNEHRSVADAKSIAVLPFENLSDEKSNAYFAEGIQDEILTRLAKIGALDFALREQPAEPARDCAAAGCSKHSRRQRAEGGQRGACQRAAHSRRDRRPSLGRELQSQAGRHFRRRG